MTIKLTMPQSALLHDLHNAGSRGVFKSTFYGPACALVSMGYAKWSQKYTNGATGTLVITQRGIEFIKGGP